jgi:hypothetical protein
VTEESQVLLFPTMLEILHPDINVVVQNDNEVSFGEKVAIR